METDIRKLVKYLIVKNLHYEIGLKDSEVLRKYLKINSRRCFNNTIKKTYKKNIDYNIEKVKRSDGSGGSNFELIILTPNISKQICLYSNSKLKKEIRKLITELDNYLFLISSIYNKF